MLTLSASQAHAVVANPLSIAVVGNHFINQNGGTVRLMGVDVPSTEYACKEGWGYASLTTSPTADAAVARSIAAWDANAVRIPLNEDCWLGINGEPEFGTQTLYQQSIENEVSALNADGIYAILDLHWSAPGSVIADGQRPMPDDHSAAFWTSVATTFKNNPAVVFDLFNEPYSPAADGNGSNDVVDWSCWENGGCSVPDAQDGTTANDADSYTAVGMQALVTAIRSTGATQPIMLGGLSYANDLSGWLTHEPTDPDHQLAASFHNYYGETCDTVTCWNETIAPVAASVPVVTGEFDQGYDCQGGPTSPPALVNFDSTYMGWADSNGVGYLAWAWWELGPATTTCSSVGGGGDMYTLIDNAGNPVAPDGTSLKSHLQLLASEPEATSLVVTPSQSTSTRGQAVTFTAALNVDGEGPVAGTVAFAVNDTPLGSPVPVSEGSAQLTTNATTLELPVGTDTVTATFDPSNMAQQLSSTNQTTETVSAASTKPSVVSLAPASGPNTGGTAVTISGIGFTGATKVLFGTTPALSFQVVSDSDISATSPPEVKGPRNVYVFNAHGMSAKVAADEFAFKVPPAAITSLSPSSGPRSGGTSVTISGSGFTGATKVLFGTEVALSFTVVSDTQITAVAPAEAKGTHNVFVFAPGGTSAKVSADVFAWT